MGRTKKVDPNSKQLTVVERMTVVATDLKNDDGKITTTSLRVAERFGKLHKNVLLKIQHVDCTPEFNRLNFEPVEYLDAKGEARTCYNLTKEGFMFTVMGFTGKEAAMWKEAFIRKFCEMEQQIASTSYSTSSSPSLAARIAALEGQVAALNNRRPAPVPPPSNRPLIRLTDMAKRLEMDPVQLCARMRKDGFLVYDRTPGRPAINVAVNKFIDQNLFAIKMYPSGTTMVPQTFVTEAGARHLQCLYAA